jgi:hypothetical protein
LLSPKSCIRGATCASNVARAARSAPTNFEFTSLDPATGGGSPADNLDAIKNTGRTAAFTVFGDFDPSNMDAANNSTGIGFCDPLDGTTANIVTGMVSQPFGGQVQHTRPAVDACVLAPIAPVEFDANLSGPVDNGALTLVERTFAWLSRNRRLGKDFEAMIGSAQAWLYLASVQLLARPSCTVRIPLPSPLCPPAAP